MKNTDLSKIIKNKHHQCWIALDRTQKRVVAWGKNINLVIKAAKQAGESKPVVMFAMADFRGLVS